MSLRPKRQGVSDRISELPNDVLCRTLSFLPTKYAVRTTVLSKIWKNIWTSVPNLYFCDNDYPDVNAFMAFVDRVLDSHDLSRIQKFCLHSSCFDIEPSILNRWICTAIRHNVRELDLFVHSDAEDYFELPQTLFTSKNLEVLKLQFNFIANPPASKCFPSLKSLCVVIQHPESISVKMLFSYLPVLEDLEIRGYLEYYDVDVNVSAPELRKLGINLAYGNADGGNDHKLCVNAPKLESLDVKLDSLSKFLLLINANSVVKANVDLLYEELSNGGSADVEYSLEYKMQADRAIDILKNISNVKYLSLSIRNLEGDLPAFDNLNQLNLVFYDCGYWGFLIKLLSKSPDLQHLVFEHEDCSICNEVDFRQVLNPPKFAPLSLMVHLKTITVNGFKGRREEVQVVREILQFPKVFDCHVEMRLWVSELNYYPVCF
ncbi:hypothetical protein ACFX2J_030775 [Malus domestica]